MRNYILVFTTLTLFSNGTALADHRPVPHRPTVSKSDSALDLAFRGGGTSNPALRDAIEARAAARPPTVFTQPISAPRDLSQISESQLRLASKGGGMSDPVIKAEIHRRRGGRLGGYLAILGTAALVASYLDIGKKPDPRIASRREHKFSIFGEVQDKSRKNRSSVNNVF